MARPTKREQINKKISKGVSKMTPDVLQKLETSFSLDSTVEEAVVYAGISESTYYKWCKDNKELSERFSQLKQKPILIARQSVINQMKTDGDLALKYLERKKPLEFGQRQKIEHDGKVGFSISELLDQAEKTREKK